MLCQLQQRKTKLCWQCWQSQSPLSKVLTYTFTIQAVLALHTTGLDYVSWAATVRSELLLSMWTPIFKVKSIFFRVFSSLTFSNRFFLFANFSKAKNNPTISVVCTSIFLFYPCQWHVTDVVWLLCSLLSSIPWPRLWQSLYSGLANSHFWRKMGKVQTQGRRRCFHPEWRGWNLGNKMQSDAQATLISFDFSHGSFLIFHIIKMTKNYKS